MNTTKKCQINNEKEVNYYFDRQPNVIFNQNNYYYDYLIKFENYLIYRKYSNSTIYEVKRSMKHFFGYLENNNILNLKDIDLNTINDYINSFPKYYCKQTLKNIYKDFRLILKYFYEYNLVDKDLSVYVPHIKVSKNSTIPSYWSKEEVKKIFNQINLETKSGKRLYLVLILALKYGLRYSDIINLKFNNIDWDNNIINLTQTKTKKYVTFPLLLDVSNALIDYIKNARPKSNEKNIILKANGEIITGHIFYKQIDQLIRKANVEYSNKKRGIHSMRHTLASTLLKENIPLPIISKVLEHSSSDTTMVYTKIDENKLRKCCLTLEEVKVYE